MDVGITRHSAAHILSVQQVIKNSSTLHFCPYMHHCFPHRRPHEGLLTIFSSGNCWNMDDNCVCSSTFPFRVGVPFIWFTVSTFTNAGERQQFPICAHEIISGLFSMMKNACGFYLFSLGWSYVPHLPRSKLSHLVYCSCSYYENYQRSRKTEPSRGWNS